MRALALALALAFVTACAREVVPMDGAVVDAFDAPAPRDVRAVRDAQDAVDAHDAAPDVIAIDATTPLVLEDGCDPGPAPDASVSDAEPPYALTALEQHPILAASACALPMGAPIAGDGVVTLRRADGTICRSFSPGCISLFPLVVREPLVMRMKVNIGLRTRCDDAATQIPVERVDGDGVIVDTQARLEAGTYFLDARPDPSSSTFRVAFSRPAPNYDCATPRDIPLCTWITAPNERGALTDLPLSDDNRPTNERSYRVPVSRNDIVRVRGGYALGCGPLSERQWGSLVYLGPVEADGSLTFRASGPAVEAEVLPAAPNRECATAARLVPDVALVQRTGLAGTAPIHSCRGTAVDEYGAPSYTPFYVVDIPPRSRATISSTYVHSLRIEDSCEALCVLRDGGLPSDHSAVNESDVPIRKVVAVTAYGGDVTLHLGLETL